VDETYVKVKGRWLYLYRAVDSCGQTIDFLLSAKRDAEAVKRFFRKALAQPHRAGRPIRAKTYASVLHAVLWVGLGAV
jgi:transposase-like protein